LTEWYRRWFYVREEPGSSTFCDVGYVPEKRASWSDRPEYDGQVADLMKLIDWSRLDGLSVVGNFICRRVMPCQKRVHSAYEYAGSADPTRMRSEILEKAEVQQLLNELFNFADGGFTRSSDRVQAFKLGRPAPKVCSIARLIILMSSAVGSPLLLLQVGDVDRCVVYASLAPGMEDPVGEVPSEEDRARPVPTSEERVAGKRPLPANPLPTPELPADLPAESSQAPKRRRLVRIVDDDEDDEEAAPSLVRRPRDRPDAAPVATDRVASDAAAPQVAEVGAQAPTGRARRRFTATHRRSDL
jgi:hypothetical protein